jgi:hypothetical protein
VQLKLLYRQLGQNQAFALAAETLALGPNAAVATTKSNAMPILVMME